TAEDIDHRAAAWAARLDRGPFSTADQREFEAWAAEDSRRLGAFARARAVALHSRQAAALRGGALSEKPVMSRRSLLAAGAAVGMLSGTGLAAAYWRRSQRLDTARGEICAVALDDGSVVTLNTQSRVSVRYTRSVREVVLMYGEALFEVAVDPVRPFIMRAAGAVLTTYDGSFLLKRLNQAPLEVVAIAGSLHMRTGRDQAQILAADQRIRLGKDATSSPRPLDSPTGRMLAWRDGKVEFHDESLQVAAAEFARFSGVPIELADRQVAEMKITGLFEANDSAAFARAAARSLNLRAEIGSTRILLSRG
ncbi:MAG: FecR domain-containing protein, partial [Alphaproteobacteria bacterium]|nr:FecR domain-containing protein [Alphaproteobacteria bacterium]